MYTQFQWVGPGSQHSNTSVQKLSLAGFKNFGLALTATNSKLKKTLKQKYQPFRHHHVLSPLSNACHKQSVLEVIRPQCKLCMKPATHKHATNQYVSHNNTTYIWQVLNKCIRNVRNYQCACTPQQCTLWPPWGPILSAVWHLML